MLCLYTVSLFNYYIDVTPFAVGGPYQVQLTYNFPNISTVETDLGVATIGPSLEFLDGHGSGIFSVNLKLRKITITSLRSVSWSSGAFNGPVFTLLTSGATLPQPAYFISSPIDTSFMTLTSTATTIALNWKDVQSFTPYDVVVIGW
jgi:hypothetical protein